MGGRHLSAKVAKPALALMLAAVLGGCGFYDAFFGEDAPPPCPDVSVLADAASLTRFKEGPGRDLIDVLFGVEIADIQRACEYDIDDDTGEGPLTTEITVFFRAERGPADRQREGRFKYFVTITDAGRNVLNKGSFGLLVEFPDNLTRTNVADEPVTMVIPLKANQSADDFRIIVGFELTREELELNRRRRAISR